jgi:glutamate-ammonia-ligase adenylyltransferase
MAGEDTTLLCDAFRAYRRRAHRLTLQEQKAVVDETEFESEREGVIRLWRALMEQ